MNPGTISQVLYAFTGTIFLLFAVVGVVLQSSVSMMISFAMPEELAPGAQRFHSMAITLSLYALTGMSLLLVALRRDSILLSPRRTHYLFLAAALPCALTLLFDFKRETQEFHFGHLLLAVSLSMLVREFFRERARRRRLSALSPSSEVASDAPPEQPSS